MELDEVLKGLETKVSEIKKIKVFSSKHFAFRNWHATVMQLLRELPSPYLPQIGDFKKLTFEDTGFKRGRKFLSSSNNSKFLEDLDASALILKDIIKKDKPEEKKMKPGPEKAKSEKPDKPEAKKGGDKKPVKTGPRKAPASKGARKPAKTGGNPARKKKKD